ncbi:hypothetical protein HBI55_161480 [Parastagonospora nodorum]|nr:hypothetical protein HBH51_151770 [Parastagonospora nodorum]KAH4082147.1 hypothetical protein HBH48_190530 [Parastagonospora nodorum]KAH4226731.1 hypothetical protein HBI05_216590 [Parastagonospora nodorum]KAH4239773.1 hypothetical protein HBI06_026120 [Parastagonospora nodorum]KAH4702991.1 hypothetical protein HBH67_123400 [Parastagonospora nodorum]
MDPCNAPPHPQAVGKRHSVDRQSAAVTLNTLPATRSLFFYVLGLGLLHGHTLSSYPRARFVCPCLCAAYRQHVSAAQKRTGLPARIKFCGLVRCPAPMHNFTRARI